jgi:hypothetical protein
MPRFTPLLASKLGQRASRGRLHSELVEEAAISGSAYAAEQQDS